MIVGVPRESFPGDRRVAIVPGLCEQTAVLLANGGGLPIESIAMPRFRPPLRPLPLAVLQDDFHANLAANWEVWFGIRSQWKPYWSLDDPPDEREDATYGK